MPERLLSRLDRALALVQDGLANEGLAWLAAEPAAKVAALRRRGRLPAISPTPPGAIRPITFVVVRCDGLCAHNLLASPALTGRDHRVVVVDDPFGLRHGSLARGVAAGLAEAAVSGDGLVAIVGQDAWLPAGWPGAVGQALSALEASDPDWGVAGLAGVDDGLRRIGHVSDPWGPLDTFAGQARFAEARSLEDAAILIRPGRGPAIDTALPGFEGIGASLSARARALGRRCYVIDAPAAVEPFDHEGRPVARALGSRRVRGQLYRQQRVQRHVTLEYLAGPSAPSRHDRIDAPFRWSSAPRPLRGGGRPPAIPAVDGAVDSPVVLLGKGGGGSRLLSLLAADLGVFVGRVNVSGDCLDMVPAVYAGVLRAFDCPAAWQRDRVVEGLREGARAMLASSWSAGEPWGFKVPESLLLVPEIHAAFPGARFLLMARHPAKTCLRRVHMTAEPDNPIGRVSLSAAYLSAGLRPAEALADPVEIRSAIVTRHQVGTALEYLRSRVAPDRYLEVRFEDAVSRPQETRALVGSWLGLDAVSHELERAVDAGRAHRRSTVSPVTVRRVEQLLAPLSAALGYETTTFDD